MNVLSYGRRREDPKVNGIVSKIEQLSKLSDLKTKDFAKEGGYADILAQQWRKGLKTTQLRKFFAAMKDMTKDINYGITWNDIEDKFHLLLPQTAYAHGRGLVPDGFLTIMKICMKKVDVGTDEAQKIENFKTFVKFIESIVAYHKYYNPRA